MGQSKVLSVGQCAADHWMINKTLEMNLDVKVVPAATATEASKLLSSDSFSLVLVNRIFDADGGSGLDFIQRLKTQGQSVPVMLVSNHADAQKKAIANGAVPGFGKASLGQPEMLEAVSAHLGERQDLRHR